jgi:hypothetical protein
MFAVEGFEGNVLTLIDEEITQNKPLRQLLALGRVIQASALPDEASPVKVGFTGSNRTHIEGKPNSNWSCYLVEVSEIKEEPGNTPDSVVLTALAGCWCGRLINHPVAMEISTAELTTRVTKADDESFS